MTISERVLSWFTRLFNVLEDSNERIVKKGGVAAEDLIGLPDSIDTIPQGTGGTDTADADAEPYQVLAGAVFYNKNGRNAGTMPDNSGYSGTFDGITTDSLPIPKGYHDGKGSIGLTKEIANEVDTQEDVISEISAILDRKASAYPEITYNESTKTLTITEVI